MRYKLTIEYDGGPFSGWQRLGVGASVQGALEDAVFALTGARSDVVGAGRTDAGVHAQGQVAHVDIEKPFAPQRLADALNAHLRPHPIAVLAAAEAAPAFHARFDAVRRSYLYRIVNRRAPLTLDQGKAWRVPRALDVAAMHEAAQRLVGRHDFTTFRDSQCQAKSPVKTLDLAEVLCLDAAVLSSPVYGGGGREATGGGSSVFPPQSRASHLDSSPPPKSRGDFGLLDTAGRGAAGGGGANQGEQVCLAFSAQSFLHRQVRSMVGTLVEVGLGKMSADDLADALAAADRRRCGPVAPPDGLYLVRVDY
jgi:tRNA pseudouridine38-40 synthase